MPAFNLNSRLHLDRRAHLLIASFENGAADDCFTNPALAELTGYSEQFFEIGRCRGYGPKFARIGGKVYYRRGDIIAWLQERAKLYECRQAKKPKRTIEAVRVTYR
jgi:hypothetical protein